MAERQWYVARGDNKDGPFTDARLRELISAGTVTADTLVWCDGMSNWAKAGEVPGLITQAQRAPPVPAQPQAQLAQGAAPPAGTVQPLSTTVRTWPLFGRLLLLGLCEILVIPLPWAATSFARWFVDHIEVPGQQRVTFTGKAGDIWYVFIIYALFLYLMVAASLVNMAMGTSVGGVAYWIFLPLSALLALVAARWFYANLAWEGRAAPLRFTGGYWALLGWSVLAPFSVITIIGWAWVYTAWGRWMCRNVKGADRTFVFTASGWSFLWRTIVYALCCALVIPIPWILRWYIRWLVSRFALVE